MNHQQRLSREPNDYSPGEEFVLRKKQRSIPGGAIRKCIEQGTAEPARKGRVKLTTTHRGDTFSLIVDPSDGVVVTGYRERNHHANDSKHIGFAD